MGGKERQSSSRGDIVALHRGSSCNSLHRRGPVGDSQQKYGKPPADLSKPTVSSNAGKFGNVDVDLFISYFPCKCKTGGESF